jgi:glyoxylate reductase
MSTVFISRRIFPEAIAAFKPAGVSFTMHDSDAPLSKDELIRRLKGFDGLICLLNDQIDKEVIASSPSLKVISNLGVGYNNIDVDAATQRGIWVTNTPDVLTETTADLAFALMISAARRITEADKSVREGNFGEWRLIQNHSGADLYGKTLGIIGLGRIGYAVARRGHKGFDMEVLYYGRSANRQADEELKARHVGLDELLAKSDFISIHVPLNDKTRHLLGAAEFARMKKEAFLVNTSRGPVIDEEALAEALLAGTIRGAGLDVYENEPAINPKLLKIEQNLVLTPHIGSATLATRTSMAHMAVNNMITALKGQRPPNPVNDVKPR